MYSRVSLLFLALIAFYNTLQAQIFPQEGSKLCYRIIGFSFPAAPGAVQYSLQVARGDQQTESSFEKNTVITVPCKKNKVIAEVPSFGSDYTWRITVLNANNTRAKGPLYHFSVRTSADVDPAMSRLRIIKKSATYKDSYVIVDGTRVLYDMEGKPVWFLPATDFKVNAAAFPRDFKTTPQGTITFITGEQPYEISYDRQVLWHHKSGTPDGYFHPFHHEFTRLDNGHYMGLMYDDITGIVPQTTQDSVITDEYDSAGYYRSRLSGSLVELDENDNVVWRWSTRNYIYTSDLRYRQTADFHNVDHDIHDNAFFFDKQNNIIYLSFKTISRVIKISYPSGEVLNTYGLAYKPGVSLREGDQFSVQHSCKRSQNGDLYLYNNNAFGRSNLPTVQMFEEPGPGESNLKKVWEYQCTVESDDPVLKQARFFFGGCVTELPDRSMFIFMGKPYPKLSIVSHDKKILWSAIQEKYNTDTKKWEIFTKTYRASLVSRKELEQLIWASQQKS